jgi:hypothetical protein
MKHNRPWNLPGLPTIARLLAPTPGVAINWTFAMFVLLCVVSCAAGLALSAGEAHAAATAADWATNATGSAAAAQQQAAQAAGWSWGELAAGAGGALLFLSRFIPGWGGIVADYAWRWFADRRAREADAAQSAAAAALGIVHQVAPTAVAQALDRLPPERAAAARALLPKA